MPYAEAPFVTPPHPVCQAERTRQAVLRATHIHREDGRATIDMRSGSDTKRIGTRAWWVPPALGAMFLLMAIGTPLLETDPGHEPAGEPASPSTLEAAQAAPTSSHGAQALPPGEETDEEAEDPPEVEVIEPVVPLFEVEGTLQAQTLDPDPATSGIQGTLTVNGFTFEVPVGVPVRVGDAPGESMPFDAIDDTPSLIGRSTLIATGTGTFLDGTSVAGGLRWVADDVFLEEAENVLFGIVTANGTEGLFVSGVPIVLETDPRFAPFNRVVDGAGQPIDLEEVPVGQLAAVEGVFRTDTFHARVIELETIVPPSEGEDDFITIDRGELRVVRGELRLRGVGNLPGATLTIYDWVDGARGAQIATGVTVEIDGAWRFRGEVAELQGAPPMVEVVSSGGGRALFEPVLR